MSESQAKIEEAIQQAYQALAQNQPQAATLLLAPFAKASEENEAFTLCWLALLGFMEDEKALEKEFRRLLPYWMANSRVMTQMTQLVLAWAKKNDFRTVYDEDSLVFLMAQALGFHIYNHPPSQAEQRSKLYERHAQLCSLGDLQGEEQALEDLEIALSLYPKNAEAWFLLSRIHGKRGRWKKALLSLEQIDQIEGIDKNRPEKAQKNQGMEQHLNQEKIQWQRAMLTLALSFNETEGEQYCYQNIVIWEDLGHQDFQLDRKHRPCKTGYDQIEVYLHTEMTNTAGQYESDREFKAEKVWVQPLSPCHGRIIQPSILDFCADFDDLIIWDVQPVEGHDTQAIFKAIGCLEKGKASSKAFKVPVLSQAQLDQVNQMLSQKAAGVFFYQSLDLDMPHGKLIYPKDQPLFELLNPFGELIQSFTLKE